MDITLLHKVSVEGDVHAIREMIRVGAEIEAKDSVGRTPLHYASAEGHTDAIGELVRLGADIEAKDTSGDSPLHRASVEGHPSAITKLVSLGADVGAKNNVGISPLHQASFWGHPDAIIKLVSMGADVEAKGIGGATPLHFASGLGHPDAINELVRLGADIEAKSSRGTTPLHFASGEGHHDAIMKLVNLGADVEAKSSTGATPLHDASFNKHPGAIKELVSLGADIEAKTTDGETPLLRVARLGHLHTIKELVSLGADIEAKTTDGETPLIRVARLGHDDALKELVSLGANVHSKDPGGNTCLIHAAIKGRSDMVRTLIQAGANLNSVDSHGVTALTHATRGVSRRDPGYTIEHWQVARILAENRANGDEGYRRYPSLLQFRMGGNKMDYNRRSKDLHRELHNPGEVARLVLDGADVDAILGGYTPLMRACLRNILETVKILVNAGASMEKRGVDGYTPIIISSSLGNTEIVKFLIEAGADILSKSDPPKNRFTRRLNVGYNCLMVACFSGHIDTVQTLIEGGIDMDDVDSEGNTALHIAAIQTEIEIVKLLIGKGARVNTVNAKGASPLMMATVAGQVEIVDILTSGGAHIDIGSLTMGQRLRTMLRRGPMLDTTFNQRDLLNHTISRTGYLGNCVNVNDLRLQDGRCVQMNTREARRVMMNLLNAPVDPSRFVLPVQRSGTCWFYATISALFVSDRTRRCTLDLRRIMIMGRQTVHGVKFPPPLAQVFVKLNVVIQAILCGNTHEGSVHSTLPIINNDEVVLGLHENGVTTSGLNCGYNPIFFIRGITKTLFDLEDAISLPGFLDTRSSVHTRSSVYVERFSEGMEIRKTINGMVYETDSVTISGNDHVISGLTLAGEKCIYDSNVGVIKMDWEEFWKEPDKTFKVNGLEFSFLTSRVWVFRCPLSQLQLS